VSEEGLRFPAFVPERHFIKPFPIPKDHLIYVGVDLGSGLNNHPASIVFIAVNPDFTKGYIFKGWRGNDVETSAGDVMDKFMQMKGALKPVCQVYDHASKEFGIIASRIGEPFERADKSRDLGTHTVNTLFKNDMLFIFDIEELQPLGGEFLRLRHNAIKRKAKDDFIDSTVYGLMHVHWDWSCIVPADYTAKQGEEEKKDPERPLTPKELAIKEINDRRAAFDAPKPVSDIDEEVLFWNDFSNN
jgi:hypothetical protein